jgi:folylpolyglutamate synthase/dihydropteroate synthase
MAEKIEMKSKACEYVPDALSFIKENFYDNSQEKEEDSIILICGSLYLAGDVLKINQGLI